ncbi:phospholipase D family protein [Roseivivax lentus]|nr:phospholipase D family protein [Roseivivax lentus]
MALRLMFPLPDLSGRTESNAIPAAEGMFLGDLMARGIRENGSDMTGIHPLARGDDALTSRLALINAAQVSIDAQYYIWHDDVSGMILLDALHRAARRGVRVRLLVDDNGVPGMDAYLAALSAVDGFEVRLFNPSTVRSPKLLGYAFDFFRMNRRMHNKSMIADGAFSIIGGRNIGDEYFRVGEDIFYLDMDAIATGAVVPETADIFDQYWNAPSVFEIGQIVDGEGDLAAFDERVRVITATSAAKDVFEGAQDSLARIEQWAANLEWTRVQVVADDPIKGQGIASADQLMISRLSNILGDINTRLDLASAYFVPGQKGTAFFTDLRDQEVEVQILTNALDTTDVFLVHSGYTRYRRELLESGISLFELKSRGESPERNLQVLPLGLSGASLHAKTFSIDQERVFIGSFNFDPRSALLNCEMGFLIDSPAIAEKVSTAFDGPLATVSYQPGLTPEGKMIWREPLSDDRIEVYQEEPGANWSTQIALAIIGLLPIEWLL